MGKLSGPACIRVLNMEQKNHFPLFCDIQGKKAVVIGGGAIAARRCRTLSRFAFALHIIARRSEGSAAISVFAVGLVGELALPSTLLRI